MTWDPEAEKRIRHVVFCAEQLVTKRIVLWNTRYERAIRAITDPAELDEAVMRVHAKYPHLGLDKIVAAQ